MSLCACRDGADDQHKINLRDHSGAGDQRAVRRLVFPSHRALLSELRAFEYGLVGRSGRAPMGARPGAHDDTVMGLALAVFAAP